MSRVQVFVRLTLLIGGIGSFAIRDASGDAPAAGDTLVIRLFHPDRQAAAVLKLFDGARAAHPAAALVGWKRATRGSNPLGKPLEAAIAMFNPEMAREWQVVHDAELCLDMTAADGKARWYAVVPRDDGTLAALVTAMRLTDGAALPPLTDQGKEIAVERLGPPGAIVSARNGDLLVLGSSRDELLRGLRQRLIVSQSGPARSSSQRVAAGPDLANPVDSGLTFDLDPARMNAGAGTTTNRRVAALLHGLGCQRLSGHLALKDDVLAVEVTTFLKRTQPTSPIAAAGPAVVDPTWLTSVPAQDLMGVVSVALEPGDAFWNSAFALADRVDRADPSRADVAPLRTRFNLLAAAVGARPEVDLWPHLRGVTAGVMAGPDQPGQPSGALVVLHTDGDASAERLTNDVLPRLSALWTGKKPGGEPARRALPGPPAGGAAVGDAVRLGAVGGRSLLVCRRGRDVVIAWGDQVLAASSEAAARPDRSVAPLCTGWLSEGKKPPQRVGALWPARCWPAVRGLDTTTPAWRTLAQGPPAVWWGWTGPNEAQDSIHYSGLRQRVHQFLDQLPLDLSPLE